MIVAWRIMTITRHSILHSTALHCTALHCTAMHNAAQHWTALHSTALLVEGPAHADALIHLGEGVGDVLPLQGSRIRNWHEYNKVKIMGLIC